MKTSTLLHVLISLAGIFAGFVVPSGLLAGKPRDGWTKFFLATAVATSVTGFFFPFHGLTAAIAPLGQIGVQPHTLYEHTDLSRLDSSQRTNHHARSETS